MGYGLHGLWAMVYDLRSMPYGLLSTWLWAMGYGLWSGSYGLWATGYLDVLLLVDEVEAQPALDAEHHHARHPGDVPRVHQAQPSSAASA